MKKSSTRIGAILCAAGLMVSLAACSGDEKKPTPSTSESSSSSSETTSASPSESSEPTTEETETSAGSDAKADCDFLLGELSDITTSINSAMTEIQSGTNQNEVLQPIVDRLNADVAKMTSDEVREPLANFAKEVEETFALIADLDYAAIQAGDADAVAKAQEVTPEILAKQEVLPEAGSRIDTVCKAIS